MGATVRWAAWWLLAAAALGACIWLSRYEVTATSNAGGLMTVTLDRWTGSEEACTTRACALIDRSRLELSQPPASAAADTSFDFDKALDQASKQIEAQRADGSSDLQGRLSNGVIGAVATALLIIAGFGLRTLWRGIKGRLSP